MKNTDIALIILIAAISVIASYFLGNFILGDPADLTSDVVYVDPIDSGVTAPDIEFFNTKTLNPTVEIYIGHCEEGQVLSDNVCVDAEGNEHKPIVDDNDDDDDSEEEERGEDE